MGTSRVRARCPRRTLKDRVVRGLAQVGLLWSLALLWFVFSAMAAQGTQAAELSASGSRASVTFSAPVAGPGGTPSTVGLVLALVVLTGGVTVLVWGSLRGATSPRAELPGLASVQPAGPLAGPSAAPLAGPPAGLPGEPPGGLELALGLGLAPYRATV